MTKWCNNCETYKDSWSDKGYSKYKYHVRCWSCDKWSLVYSSDKNLYDWWLNGISTEQKDIIKKFGIDTSSSSKKKYDRSDLWKLWYWDEIIKKNFDNITTMVVGRIQQMNFFSTEWNNNLLIVINGEGNYGVHLLVYEMPMKVGNPSSGSLENFYVGSYSNLGYNHRSDNSAKKRVYELERTLRGDNPILYNEPKTLKVFYTDDYNSSCFPSMFDEGEVKRIELPYYSAKENPDDYIKPLDIVKIFIRSSSRSGRAPYMVHACIYLGNKKICHARYGNRVEIDDWSEFFKLITDANKMIRYHPVIAFKNPRKIIEHIAKCIEGKERYFVIKNDFDVLGDRERQANNCECLGNRCVLGLNFSELATRRIKGSSESNFDYSSSTSSLRNQLTENKEKLDDLTRYVSSSEVSDRIREIESYKDQGNENRIAREVDREGIEMQNCIEVQPNSDFRMGRPIVIGADLNSEIDRITLMARAVTLFWSW